LTIISTVHTKHGFVFAKEEKISAKELHEILAMIENPKEEKILYQN
jgi:hypothetical protein